MAWYYDPVEEQCREFIYGGCAGNENRFPNETECYKRCRERLIDLHPPTKVTVALGLEDRVLLYWYPPKNYRLHEESNADTPTTITAKGAGVTHKEIIVTTTAVPEGSLTVKPQQNSSQNSNTNNTDSDTINQNNTKTSIDKTTNTSVDSDSKSNVTDSDSKSNVTESGSKTNITENVNDNKNVTVKPNVTESVNDKNVSASDETDKLTAKPNEPTSTEKSSDEGTTQGTTLKTNTDNSTTDGSKLVVYQLKDFIGKKKVPFHFGNLTGYQVSYKKAEDENGEWITIQNLTLTPDDNEYWLTDLSASTKYIIRVGAMYITNTTVFAEVNGTTQADPHAKRACMCHPVGTVGGGRGCNFSLTVHPWCKCNPAYSGLFCEFCHSGYYRITDLMPCHKCPCSYVSSTQSCHFIEGYLHCLRCKEGYMGRLCQHCANGYFRDHRHTGSVCAKCHGCHDVGQGLICDPQTGRCIKCHYNTTGHRCDRCLKGFQGDPLNNITCTWIETKKPGLKMLSPGVIAVICVTTILIISGAVGCIIYRRMRNYPSHRPFWTIELKEGHEGVNFSSVPDDDNDRYHDDVRFFEKESKSKSQPYHKLQEDI